MNGKQKWEIRLNYLFCGENGNRIVTGPPLTICNHSNFLVVFLVSLYDFDQMDGLLTTSDGSMFVMLAGLWSVNRRECDIGRALEIIDSLAHCYQSSGIIATHCS